MTTEEKLKKALKYYQIWIKYYPREINVAMEIAAEFLDTKKEEQEFNKLLKTLTT